MNTNSFSMTNLSDEEYRQIGERLAFLRSEVLQLNQSQCANALDISQTYLSLLESGKRKISMDTLKLYAERFDVSFEWLVSGDDSHGIISKNSLNNANYYISHKKQDSLSSLVDAYQLNKAESDFISRFLSMDGAERKHFIHAIEEIRKAKL